MLALVVELAVLEWQLVQQSLQVLLVGLEWLYVLVAQTYHQELLAGDEKVIKIESYADYSNSLGTVLGIRALWCNSYN